MYILCDNSISLTAKNNAGSKILYLRACSYGQKLSRLPRKHFDRSNNVVLFIWRNVFPLTVVQFPAVM